MVQVRLCCTVNCLLDFAVAVATDCCEGNSRNLNRTPPISLLLFGAWNLCDLDLDPEGDPKGAGSSGRGLMGVARYWTELSSFAARDCSDFDLMGRAGWKL